MTAMQQIEQIPLEVLFPSEQNARKTFDQAKLEELAASIKLHGVLQPLLVERRAVAKNLKRGSKSLPTFEIVAGERRFRAAQLAELKELPCIVRSFSVADALAVNLIENLQREGLDPVEEAEGIGRLLKADVPAAEIAERLGKSKAYVYGGLKLLNVPAGEAIEALRSGRLSRNHGILIGRIPSEKLRAKAVQAILHPKHWRYSEHQELAGQAMTYRDAKEYVERECMVELKGAPFDRKSLDLVPEAGSCEGCPKRTGNNPDDFPDARADVCTDPECFRAKEKAAHEKAAAKLANSGKKVLSLAESRKILNGPHVRFSAPYRDLSEKCHLDDQRRTLKKLVGEELKLETIHALDDHGKWHELAPKNRVEELLEEKGVGMSNGGRLHNGSHDRNNWEMKNRIKERFHERCLEHLFFELNTITSGVLGLGPGCLEDLLVDLVNQDMRGSEAAEKVLGWLDADGNYLDTGKAGVKNCRDAFKALLLIELDNCVGHYWDPTNARVKAFAERFAFDPAEVYKKAKKEIEAEEKAKADHSKEPKANGANGKHKKAAAAKS